MSNPSNSHIPQDRNSSVTVPARFVRLPSIAEQKLGTAYVAPVRLDPRALEQMQQTIKSLSSEYAVKLASQIRELLHMINDVCHPASELRGKFYDSIHDMRGLAGTFGHPIVGQFANSLCRYMEDTSHLNATILRFHVEAMRDAIDDKMPDKRLADETLRSLERLILNAKNENFVVGRESLSG